MTQLTLPHFSFKLRDHYLIGENVSFKASPNTSGLFSANGPDTIVIHFTAGSSLHSSVDVLTNADSGVSAHFAIGRSGDIVQMLPTNRIAWHAGESVYAGRRGLNRYSIGIELDNAGQLKAKEDGLFESWFGSTYDESEVIAARHPHQSFKGYWHKYTDIQIAATMSLCRLLCEHYPISTVVGHDEIAPSRKVDPGPAFPMEELRKSLVQSTEKKESHSDKSSERGLHTQIRDKVIDVTSSQKRHVANVSANSLNVRTGPSILSPLVEPALYKGEVLNVLEKRGEWAKVSFTKTGWVNTHYINEISVRLPLKR
ncbi:hypothetical protein KUL156_31810 [Alteromonas sp. KUL156]|nr:hypothetical protein KUL154_45840 [Alteromonas sp. KUL154]GFE00589.1 hypothetical protein KUL156_31810 [Alteromonas sp. KUL156]